MVRPIEKDLPRGPADSRTYQDVVWELITVHKAISSCEIIDKWYEFLNLYGTSQRLFQTPEWLSEIDQQSGPGERVAIAVARRGEELIGLVPLHLTWDYFQFRSASRTFYRSSLLKLSFLGGSALLPEDHSIYDGLFAELEANFPDCDGLAFTPVMQDSFFWNYVQNSVALRKNYFPQIVDGLQLSYSMSLPASFADYLAKLRRKKRYNRGREVRLLRDHAKGALHLERIDSPEAVPQFIAAINGLGLSPGRRWANSIPNRSREVELRWLSGVARCGFLCSYILKCGAEPVAGLIGYQFEDTCVVEYTLYSKSYAPFSPGAVLLHLAIEDLISRGIRLIDFGFGFPAYSDSSMHVVREGAAIIVWRKSLANRLLCASYQVFRVLARSIRRVAIGMRLWRRNPPRRNS